VSLPTCKVQNPACGACGMDTDFDGDSFACYDCGLNYFEGDDYTEAEFLEEVSACGVECSNGWHKTPSFDLACEPCKLPKGHKSMCWTDCKDKP
jgi:hypothetical protein